MNEKTKLLAGKALDTAVSYTWTTLDYEQIHELLACHAELIVKECINVCEPVLDEPYEDMSEFGKGLVEGQDVAVEKIKKHFGVEE